MCVFRYTTCIYIYIFIIFPYHNINTFAYYNIYIYTCIYIYIHTVYCSYVDIHIYHKCFQWICSFQRFCSGDLTTQVYPQTSRGLLRCQESGRIATSRAVASGRGLQAGHRAHCPCSSWGQACLASIHATLETWQRFKG